MKDLHSLRLQGYIDDLSLDCACEYTNLQLKKFLHTNIAYQQTLAIRLLNKRIGYQKDYQKQLKEMLDDNPAYYTKQEIEGFLSLINEKEKIMFCTVLVFLPIYDTIRIAYLSNHKYA